MFLLVQLFPVRTTAMQRSTMHPCAQQKSLTRRLSCIKKDLVAGAGFEPATFGL
jgi:hypothetical protein